MEESRWNSLDIRQETGSENVALETWLRRLRLFGGWTGGQQQKQPSSESLMSGHRRTYQEAEGANSDKVGDGIHVEAW